MKWHEAGATHEGRTFPIDATSISPTSADIPLVLVPFFQAKMKDSVKL
jgi:hypothetical protein